MFLTDTNETRKDTQVETSGFPGSRHQLAISSIVLVVSCITFALFFDLKNAFEEGTSFLISVLITSFTIGLPQFLDFRKIREEILNSGLVVKRRKPKSSWLIRLEYGAFFSGMVFGPFILLFFVTPAIWFGSILGMISGFSLSQLSYLLYIRLWEKTNRVKLKRFTVWLYDEQKRRAVLEYGVRADKS